MHLLKARLNRASYWVIVGVAIAAMLVASLVFRRQLPSALVVMLIAAIPRLHDLGRSGWWAGGVFIAVMALIFGGQYVLAPQALQNALGVVVLVLPGLLIGLGALPGQKADNAFGPPPPKGLSFKPVVSTAPQTEA
ncbi:DUF805 domain-containing protein [Caulobacter endophyticus]|uniref:DUF805 domain-containing protein n=1 Tax=Caulobacter endophyticus TaxID=2172652 RepID=UPI00240FB7BE|nr:DUF805 domain-containing protein [Caulobacter endophyticus]MDG2531937.1 DUF805 domain-containing protein [Caulobacter endophyticus]